jgi:excisionase family DNA binding protein
MTSSGARLTMRVEEAAGLLGISRGLAYELVNRGELPALRLGRRLVVPVSALEDLVVGAGQSGPATASSTIGQSEQTAGNGSRSRGRRRLRAPTVDDDGGRLPLNGLGSSEG